MRHDHWSEALAIGSLAFVEGVKSQLGVKAAHRDLLEIDGSLALREPAEAYGRNFAAENESLSSRDSVNGSDGNGFCRREVA